MKTLTMLTIAFLLILVVGVGFYFGMHRETIDIVDIPAKHLPGILKP